METVAVKKVRKPRGKFAWVQPKADGTFSVISQGVQWGIYASVEEAQDKADAINETTKL